MTLIWGYLHYQFKTLISNYPAFEYYCFSLSDVLYCGLPFIFYAPQFYLYFVVFVCLQFLIILKHFFSVLLVFCQIASSCYHFYVPILFIRSVIMFVVSVCHLFVLLTSLKVIFRDINKGWINEWSIRYTFTFSRQLKHFQFNSVATVVKMPFLCAGMAVLISNEHYK